MAEWTHTLTVSTSHDSRKGVTGIGMIIRERRSGRRTGPIIAQLSEVHLDAPPGSAEALAILRALEIALDRGYSHIKIRSANNQERKHLRTRHRAETTVSDGVRSRILDLARQFASVHFGFIARRKNQSARKLAQEARLAVSTREGGLSDVAERETALRPDAPDLAESELLLGELTSADPFPKDDPDDEEIPF